MAERLVDLGRASWSLEKKFQARLAKLERGGRKVILCQPQTFMNASGEAVGAVSEFFRVPLANLLILVDDADLPFGEIRLRPSGSSGGHHGLESIEQHLACQAFARLRVGIGRRADGVRAITGHVLGQFGAGDEELLAKVLARASDQVECWLNAGTQQAMNRFNGAVSSSEKKETK